MNYPSIVDMIERAKKPKFVPQKEFEPTKKQLKTVIRIVKPMLDQWNKELKQYLKKIKANGN